MGSARSKHPAAALLLGCCCLLLLGWNGRVRAQTRTCDPLLTQPAANPLGYRLRGDRCEGIYVQEVAGTPLVVASLTDGFEPFDLNTVQRLLLSWSAPADADLHLRAIGLRRKLYYQMDSVRPRGESSYGWPADLLGALRIPQSELGIVGWTRQRVGSVERDVYVPVRVSERQSAPASSSYSLILLPASPLSEVYVTLASVATNGRPGKYIREEEPLKYNYYPAGQAIDIPIAKPPAAGLYYVLIGATLTNGGSLTTEIWFDHRPR